MTYVLVCAVAFVASGLTLFSGFGLGTLLLPVFALIFPPELAVGTTALVHLLNNLLKLALVGRHADRRVVLAFGVPALLGAFVGARALSALAGLSPLGSYFLAGREFTILPVKLVLAVLVAAFALAELQREGRVEFPSRLLGLGGCLSGFFGGLSGHQGALRSAFLVRLRLSREAFVATGVACAVLVDVARLGTYASSLPLAELIDSGHAGLVGAAVASAFAGVVLGLRFLGQVTVAGLRRFVAAALMLLALALGAGWI